MKNDEKYVRKLNSRIDLEYTDVKKLFVSVLEKKWKILFISFAFGVFILFLSYFKMPSYKTTVLIDLNSSKGSASLSNLVSKINPILSQDEALNEEEITIIKSYAVLEPVVKKLKLDIAVEPKFFPMFGKLFFYRYEDDGSTQSGLAIPFLGMNNFAWGGESIKIDSFHVPNSMKGEKFIITYLGNNKYTLTDSDGKKIINGKLNENLNYKYYKEQVSINISEIKARPGIKFKITQLSIDNAIDEILRNLNISNAGKKADLITLSYQGQNPENISRILNSIAESAVRQDINQKQEQAKKTLEFLRKHEPKVRADLAESETILHNYRSKTGNVALDQETKITMDNIAFLQNQISQVLIQKGQVEQKYTQESLQIKDVNTTIEKLTQEKEKYVKKLKTLPNADQIALNLMRDVDIQNQIYINLVEKIQQFELLKAGTVGDLSVVSYAFVPLNSSDLPRKNIVIFSIIFSIFSLILITLIRRLMFVGIQDPDIIESKFNINCLATLNESKIQRKQVQDFKKNKIKYMKFLAEIDSFDLTVEGLRSLRTNLAYQNQYTKNKIVVLLSPKPDAGKTFISANFAYILAENGKKVLLIDGDLRRGNLINYFDSRSSPKGLSEVLVQNLNCAELIMKTRVKNLDFLPRGNYSDKITSIIDSNNIEKLLMEISVPYDYVVIDTPPILSVSDSFHFCKYLSIPIIIFSNEDHDEKEIQISLKKFDMSCQELNCFIFNKVSDKFGYYAIKYPYTSQNKKYY